MNTQRFQRLSPYILLSLTIWVIGIGLTMKGVTWLEHNARAESQMRFERYHSKLESTVKAKFESVLPGLKGLRSTYLSHEDHMSRAEFRAWVAERDIAVDFPGIRGLGFIQRVDRAELAKFIRTEQADNAPDFAVRTSGSAPDLMVIKFIEPWEQNRQARGFDVGQEVNRRQAAQTAIDTGRPAMTGKVTLVQDGQKRAGFLYYLPIYKRGAPVRNVAERRTALTGLLYAPVVVSELLAELQQSADTLIDFEVFDGDKPVAEQLIYDLDGHFKNHPEKTKQRSFQKLQRLTVGGRTILIQTSTTAAFDQEAHLSEATWLGAAGSLLSTLISILIWLLGTGRARAEHLARVMTADLQSAKNQAETALRDSAALLHTLNRYNLVSVTDPSGTITAVNDAFCHTSGYSREELLGSTHKLVNSGQHDPDFWTDLWTTITSGQSWHGEICNRTKSGSLYWVSSIIAPFLGADGRIEKYISIRQDVTHGKQLENERKEMTERFTLAIEGGSDGLWDWMDVHTHAEWWSPQFYRLLGYEPDEINASRVEFNRMLHPADQAGTQKALERAMRQHQPYDIEYRLRTKSGAYRWFHARAKVFFDEFGSATRMAGSIQDIHDRQIAKTQLSENIAQMSAIFSLSPDAFVSFNADGLVSYASPAFTQLTGVNCDSVIAMNEEQLIRSLSPHAVTPLAVRSFGELSGQHHVHVDNLEAPAGVITTLEMAHPKRRVIEFQLHQGVGGTVSRIMHIRDVTQSIELDQMKSEFMSMAAHELRTPMASIYGFTELLLTRDDIQPAKQKDLLNRIYRQCEGMITIINELLDLARIESRRGKDFHREQIDLAQLVQQVVNDFQVPLDRHPPIIDDHAMPTRVWGDIRKTRQAILNVLSNAYKYSPDGGDICIDYAQSSGRRIGVRISDVGVGMTPEQLARLGERFFRADKSGKIPGTGLGISIVREIMTLMGGELEVQSEKGQGTSVTLWLAVD